MLSLFSLKSVGEKGKRAGQSIPQQNSDALESLIPGGC